MRHMIVALMFWAGGLILLGMLSAAKAVIDGKGDPVGAWIVVAALGGFYFAVLWRTDT